MPLVKAWAMFISHIWASFCNGTSPDCLDILFRVSIYLSLFYHLCSRRARFSVIDFYWNFK
jgi:hypothetical protein